MTGTDRSPGPIAVERITDALRMVLDPELGMSIVDLGLVYGVAVEGSTVTVTMTLTAPGCPIHDVMPEWVRGAVQTVPGVERVDVRVTFDPPWTIDRMGAPTRLPNPPTLGSAPAEPGRSSIPPGG